MRGTGGSIASMRDGKSSENKNKKKLSSDAIAVDISCLAKKSSTIFVEVLVRNYNTVGKRNE